MAVGGQRPGAAKPKFDLHIKILIYALLPRREPSTHGERSRPLAVVGEANLVPGDAHHFNCRCQIVNLPRIEVSSEQFETPARRITYAASLDLASDAPGAWPCPFTASTDSLATPIPPMTR